MFHAAARRLDEPFRLYGFTIGQWLVLICGGGSVIAGLAYLNVGIQVGGFLGGLVVGAPALYWLLGDSGRVDPGELVLDAARSVIRPRTYEPGSGKPRLVVITPAAAHDAERRTSRHQALPWR